MNQKEIQLKDLFIISTSRSVDKNKIKIEENAIYDFIGRTVVDNGIQGKINKLNFEPNNENCFSVIQIGQTWALWRENKWYASQNIFILEPIDKELKNHFLYFQAVINKKLGSLYGRDYNTYPTKEELNELTILIPYEGNNICYDYMDSLISELEQERISELEQERISELDKYLKTTGLNDYLLNDEDITTLNKNIKFKDFNIVDVFKVVNTHSVLKDSVIFNSGNTPYVTASEGNNSIVSYINAPSDIVDKGNCVLIGGKTMVVTYQEKDFVSNDSHNLALYLIDEKLKTKNIYLYMACVIYKSLGTKYHWGDSISKHKIQSDIIKLPVDNNGNIYYEYMERYITVVEKLTIKNVVEYKDDIIAKTKEICKSK